MTPPEDTLPQRYQSLWDTSRPFIQSGAVEIDPVLASGLPDSRRGFTLIARPDRAVQNRIVNFLDALRAVEPDQYFYQPTALHVTVLSLFTASEQHERFSAAAGDYKAAIEAALADTPAFAIEFRGITASPGAILIQGFPAGPAMENIRARLRSELLDRGLSKGVDSRYRVITAHITVMRFRKRPSDSQ
ncbi:MAG: 2'-5' RNA ligase family protein, partial [Akkermansiaceae bacterium]|nr:2'-5' RNA ligase family protein [Verrucomicrobiales bacterium]